MRYRNVIREHYSFFILKITFDYYKLHNPQKLTIYICKKIGGTNNWIYIYIYIFWAFYNPCDEFLFDADMSGLQFSFNFGSR